MPHVEIEVENEIRGMVEQFVEGMRALARKAVLQTVAQHLEVDAVVIKAPRTSIEPVAIPIESRAKRAATPSPSVHKTSVSAVRAPARSARKAPVRRAAHKRAAAKAPPAAIVENELGSEAESEQQFPTSWIDEMASTLLSHVEIEPGQGLEELALAMGTPATDLTEPIKKLLTENRIIEEQRQGQAAYYPV